MLSLIKISKWSSKKETRTKLLDLVNVQNSTFPSSPFKLQLLLFRFLRLSSSVTSGWSESSKRSALSGWLDTNLKREKEAHRSWFLFQQRSIQCWALVNKCLIIYKWHLQTLFSLIPKTIIQKFLASIKF